MPDDDYDHAAEDVSVHFSLLLDHTEGRRRVAFMCKTVKYNATGREFRSLIVREYFGPPPQRSREVHVTRAAVPVLARALEILAPPPVATVAATAPLTVSVEPAPATATTTADAKPPVLALDPATKAKLGTMIPTVTPQPERPRRVEPLRPVERRQLGQGGR